MTSCNHCGSQLATAPNMIALQEPGQKKRHFCRFGCLIAWLVAVGQILDVKLKDGSRRSVAYLGRDKVQDDPSIPVRHKP